MAKTIMIGNDVYKELKERKGEKSFTDVIRSMLEKEKPKTGKGLRQAFGILKEDDEWKDIKKKLDRGWKEWTDRYS
jgi:predicted CopG family antitoxin